MPENIETLIFRPEDNIATIANHKYYKIIVAVGFDFCVLQGTGRKNSPAFSF